MLARHAERLHLLRALCGRRRGALAHPLFLAFAVAQPIAWSLFIAFLLHRCTVGSRASCVGWAAISAAILTVSPCLLLARSARRRVRRAHRACAVTQVRVEHRPTDLTDLSGVPLLGPALVWAQETSGVSLAQIQAWAVEFAQAILKALAGLGRAAFLGALGTVIGFTLMMFILFFAIRDIQHGFEGLRSLVPMPEADKARLFEHLASVTRALVYGAGVTALAQGTLVERLRRWPALAGGVRRARRARCAYPARRHADRLGPGGGARGARR
jgi:hypothetical protein